MRSAGGAAQRAQHAAHLLVVALERVTDGLLEVVNGDKVGEEWQHVLNLEQAACGTRPPQTIKAPARAHRTRPHQAQTPRTFTRCRPNPQTDNCAPASLSSCTALLMASVWSCSSAAPPAAPAPLRRAPAPGPPCARDRRPRPPNSHAGHAPTLDSGAVCSSASKAAWSRGRWRAALFAPNHCRPVQCGCLARPCSAPSQRTCTTCLATASQSRCRSDSSSSGGEPATDCARARSTCSARATASSYMPARAHATPGASAELS